jgi:hypothetical protein
VLNFFYSILLPSMLASNGSVHQCCALLRLHAAAWQIMLCSVQTGPQLAPALLAYQAACCCCCRGAHQGKHIVTGTVHRVAIYDSHFRISNIISQTDIIK